MEGVVVRQPIIAVLSGGISGEREVSKRSAAAVLDALNQHHTAQLFDVDEEALPAGLDPARHVVFSALHGIFGADGGMQKLLEEAGFSYAGSDAASSRLCMDKMATKRVVAAADIHLAPGLVFSAASPPDPARLIEDFGEKLVLKPNSEGSSIGLHLIESESDLRQALAELTAGQWLVEKKVSGREMTVGVLHGRALGVVEIIPHSGHYDYTSKYTKGLTDYRWPAELPEQTSERIRCAAEEAFSLCGCRDFARVDFIFSDRGEAFFLEINTLPGLTETSLLPKSALCEGIDFGSLSKELVAPAVSRFMKENST
jgi:D-alanine-D-alanine ligase